MTPNTLWNSSRICLTIDSPNSYIPFEVRSEAKERSSASMSQGSSSSETLSKNRVMRGMNMAGLAFEPRRYRISRMASSAGENAGGKAVKNQAVMLTIMLSTSHAGFPPPVNSLFPRSLSKYPEINSRHLKQSSVSCST